MEAIPLPNRAKIEQLGDNKHSLTLEPLYPGYGVTIGNALRRVLLSSLPGAAATAVKIKYVDHEFSTIPNVKEDVIQIILNLKQLRVKSRSSEPVRVTLKAKGEKVVTAADIKETDQVEIINKDLHIATLDNKNSDFDMELIIEQGRGYVPVEARDNKHLEVGMIALDAIFTPAKTVHFDVSNVRVGQLTNYDKLVVVMETDGTMSGPEGFDIASHILVDHFSMLFQDGIVSPFDPPAIPAAEEAPAVSEPALPSQDNDILSTTLSNRAKNALMKKGISTIAALHSMPVDEIGNIEGLGEKTINEIKDFLQR